MASCRGCAGASARGWDEAEPPHRLGEFQTDIAPAEDDEVAGQAFKIQGFDVRHRPSGGKSGYVGDTGAGTDVDEDALAPLGKEVEGITPEVLELFQRYPWPGNVRELQSVL
jgi:hypothetical protein